MIEIALEKFPVAHKLQNNVPCTVRPLQSGDERAFKQFFGAIPPADRFLIKHRHNEHELFDGAENEGALDRRVPLVALADGGIIGSATLYQRLGGWKRHIGMVGVLTHPDFRGLGLVRHLLDDLIEIAGHCGLSRLEAEFNGEREVAMRQFVECGFEELARLPDYLHDMEARAHDWVLLGMNIRADIENAGAGD